MTPLDLATFVGVAVAFTVVVTTAAYLPVRRALRADPMAAVRVMRVPAVLLEDY